MFRFGARSRSKYIIHLRSFYILLAIEKKDERNLKELIECSWFFIDKFHQVMFLSNNLLIKYAFDQITFWSKFTCYIQNYWQNIFWATLTQKLHIVWCSANLLVSCTENVMLFTVMVLFVAFCSVLYIAVGLTAAVCCAMLCHVMQCDIRLSAELLVVQKGAAAGASSSNSDTDPRLDGWPLCCCRFSRCCCC